MRIVLPREEFLEAVSWTSRILPAKPYTPVLGGVYIIADGDETHFCAYDTEVSAEMQASATIEEEGEALVSGRLLAAISKVLPKGDVTLWDHGSGSSTTFLRCGKAEFSLPNMPPKAYPKLPELPDDTGGVDGQELAKAVAQVLPATSTDQALPHLCAVYVELAERLTLYATDKHRVAVRSLPWDPKHKSPPTRILVPARAMAELARLGDQDDVFLGFTEAASGILGIHAGSRMTTTRLIDSPFPNCKSILPKTYSGLVAVDADELRGALQRALLLDTTEFPRVHLTLGNNGIQFSAGTEGVGGITDSIDSEFKGLGMQLSCSPRYLLDAVNACYSEKVLIGLQDHKKPVAVQPFEDWPQPVEFPNDTYGWHAPTSDYIHMVMPVLGNA